MKPLTAKEVEVYLKEAGYVFSRTEGKPFHLEECDDRSCDPDSASWQQTASSRFVKFDISRLRY